MKMDPQWIIAACAAVGLLITWTGTTAGAALWVLSRINDMKKEILADSKAKHDENRVRVDAIQKLVIRHDTMLDPQFNGSATGQHRARQ